MEEPLGLEEWSWKNSEENRGILQFELKLHTAIIWDLRSQKSYLYRLGWRISLSDVRNGAIQSLQVDTSFPAQSCRMENSLENTKHYSSTT